MINKTIIDNQPTTGIFKVPFIGCKIRNAIAPPAREPNNAPAGTIFNRIGTTKAPIINTIPPIRCARTPTLNASSASFVERYTGSIILNNQINIRPA